MRQNLHNINGIAGGYVDENVTQSGQTLYAVCNDTNGQVIGYTSDFKQAIQLDKEKNAPKFPFVMRQDKSAMFLTPYEDFKTKDGTTFYMGEDGVLYED